MSVYTKPGNQDVVIYNYQELILIYNEYINILGSINVYVYNSTWELFWEHFPSHAYQRLLCGVHTPPRDHT